MIGLGFQGLGLGMSRVYGLGLEVSGFRINA